VRDEEILGLRRELAAERRRGLGFPAFQSHGFQGGLGNGGMHSFEMGEGSRRGGPVGYDRRGFGGDGPGREIEGDVKAGRSEPDNQRSGGRSLVERYSQVCIERLGEGHDQSYGGDAGEGNADADAHAHAQEEPPAALPDRKGKGRARDENINHHHDHAKDTVADDIINRDFPHGMNGEVSEGSDNPEHWEGYTTNVHAYGGHHSSITKALKRSRRGEYESLNR
jgi:hypothetical protein